MYINGHAEEARKFFLRRGGRQRLLIDISPTYLWAMDMGEFAQKMTTLIQDNVADQASRTGLCRTSRLLHTTKSRSPQLR
jgi:hypothetical protein